MSTVSSTRAGASAGAGSAAGTGAAASAGSAARAGSVARAGSPVGAVASPGIGARYVKAIEIAGLKVRYGDPQAIVKGLAIIARKAGII